MDESDYDVMVSGLELESDGDDVFDWKEIGKEGQLSVEEEVKVWLLQGGANVDDWKDETGEAVVVS